MVPFSLFQFKKFFRPKFFVIYQISIHFVWFRSTSVRVFKFVSIKEGGSNFWEEPVLQNVWIIWSHLLYFNFKSFPDPSSSWFIRFQSVLYDSGVLLSGFSNFYKLKRGDLISVGNQFFRMSELFGPPSCISILKVFQTQILFHSLYFNVFSMIQEYFSMKPEISTNQRGVTSFLWEPILQNVWIIWSPFLYFNLKSFSDPSSSSFTRFQSILYDSGVLLSGFSNFYQLKRGDLISGRNQF